jgi:hypothetical protein
MKTLILLTLSLAAFSQEKARLVINVTDTAGTVTQAKITGNTAKDLLDTLGQWMATQQTCDSSAPPVCTPKYANLAELAKALVLDTGEGLTEKYPSARLAAEAADIDARIAALQAKRKQLFDAARSEK